MAHAERHGRVERLRVLLTMGALLLSAARVWGVQAPHAVPVTHERQCVPTGEIPAGSARTISVTWRHPFATDKYDIIGSVSETGDSVQAIELGHIVIPHSPVKAAAVVFNRDASAAQSGVLCLDASAE